MLLFQRERERERERERGYLNLKNHCKKEHASIEFEHCTTTEIRIECRTDITRTCNSEL
jgi:hypothetical protein